jgi:hypothetical protein
LSQNFGEHSAVLKTRSAEALQRSRIRRRSFLDDFDSADALETACQTQATTRKFAHQIISAKATTTPRFDPSQLRQKKSGGRSQTAAWKLSILPEQEF